MDILVLLILAGAISALVLVKRAISRRLAALYADAPQPPTPTANTPMLVWLMIAGLVSALLALQLMAQLGTV